MELTLTADDRLCDQADPWTFKVKLICDMSASSSFPISEAGYVDSCVYGVTMRTQYACLEYQRGGGKKGFDWQKVFITVVFVAVFLYIVLGCVYMRKKKETTGMMESMPNAEFWGNTIGLIRDGCRFTFHQLKALPARIKNRGADSNAYDEI